jgi:hypothetical protein
MAADAVFRGVRRWQSSDWPRASFTENVRASALAQRHQVSLPDAGVIGERDQGLELAPLGVVDGSANPKLVGE